MPVKWAKTLAVLFSSVLAQATGNVLLSLGMKQLSGHHGLNLLLRALESPAVWSGTALLLLSFLLFAAALSWSDLSFLLPIISVEVVVNVAFADWFLGEPVSPWRWMGVLLISTGVVLVLRSGGRPAPEEMIPPGQP